MFSRWWQYRRFYRRTLWHCVKNELRAHYNTERKQYKMGQQFLWWAHSCGKKSAYVLDIKELEVLLDANNGRTCDVRSASAAKRFFLNFLLIPHSLLVLVPTPVFRCGKTVRLPSVIARKSSESSLQSARVRQFDDFLAAIHSGMRGNLYNQKQSRWSRCIEICGKPVTIWLYGSFCGILAICRVNCMGYRKKC